MQTTPRPDTDPSHRWDPSRGCHPYGNTFTTCKVRVPTGEDSTFCNVICFSDSAQAALMALEAGEAVALAGSLKVGVWQAQDGTARPSLDMTASAVLSAYNVSKRRRAAHGDQEGRPQRPTHDVWKAGALSPRQPHGRAPADDLDDGEPLDF